MATIFRSSLWRFTARTESIMSAFGKELIDSVREAMAIAKGTAKPARRYDVERVDVGAVRKRLQLSQSEFAQKFGLAVATVRDWEQGRRNPDRTARTLLAVIDKKPEAVVAALKKSAAAESSRSSRR
jgi:putative transcriptional regulator